MKYGFNIIGYSEEFVYMITQLQIGKILFFF